MAYKHLKWKALDLLWGNGESILRVLASAMVVIVVLATISFNGNSSSWAHNVEASFLGFWGVENNIPLSIYISTLLTISRFTFFGLFMAILVKRLARR